MTEQPEKLKSLSKRHLKIILEFLFPPHTLYLTQMRALLGKGLSPIHLLPWNVTDNLCQLVENNHLLGRKQASPGSLLSGLSLPGVCSWLMCVFSLLPQLEKRRQHARHPTDTTQ